MRGWVLPRSAVRLSGPFTVLVTWELAARFGLVNTLLFPPPSKACADLVVLVSSGYLSKALSASLFRVVCGFALAVTVGVSLGVAMARSRLVNDFCDPLIELLRPISPLALFPLAILWFGIGDGSKIFVIALAACFPVILNTFAGARSLDANLIRAARSLGAPHRAGLRGHLRDWDYRIRNGSWLASPAPMAPPLVPGNGQLSPGRSCTRTLRLALTT